MHSEIARPRESISASRRFCAEAIGTALLLAAVVGSGIMGEQLAGGNVAIALLANSVATGAALIALILTFGPISGAHFNPVVTLADLLNGRMVWNEAAGYISAQIAGAFGGVAMANLMFAKPVFFASQHARSGSNLLLSEFVATFGLMAIIFGCARLSAAAVPYAVGLYITAAYWFTSSTSFANPAVTLARSASDTFAGIRFADVPAFVVAQLIGGLAAVQLFKWLIPAASTQEPQLLVPHPSDTKPVLAKADTEDL
jgi:glycerol uptake facilitator-like aquaporin